MKLFKDFRLDTTNHILLHNEDRVALTPKGFDVLVYLLDHAGQVVSQDEVFEALWSETYVNPEVLRKYILEIRRALGDRPDRPEFIETLPKRGYRFIATVTEENVSDSPASAMPNMSEPQDILDTARLVEPEPTGKFSRWKVAILLVIVIIAAGFTASHYQTARNRQNAFLSSANSIAVLPFVDMSPAKDQKYFSDGLAEQLINDLTKVPGLKIIGRSSAFQFRGENEDLRDVGQKLRVATILEGSVQKEGNRVRITVALTKADDGFQIWTDTYDRQISDLFATQDDIAQAVTDALKLKLLPQNSHEVTSTSRGTNPEAYEAYLLGQYFRAQGTDTRDLKEARDHSDQSIKLDGNYAPAWAQRSQLLRAMADLTLLDYVDGSRQARESAEKAIALNPDLADGYLALAEVQIDYDWDWNGADASLKRAGLLEPGSAQVLEDRADLSATLGHIDEAIQSAKQAIELDPLKANFNFWLGSLLYIGGRNQEAMAVLHTAQELNPRISSLHLIRCEALLAEGRPREALAETAKESAEWAKLTGGALAYSALGERQKSDDSLRKLIAAYRNVAAYQISEVYAYRGEIDKAFEWLDSAYQMRDPGAPSLKADPLMRSLFHDARYVEMLRKMHLPT